MQSAPALTGWSGLPSSLMTRPSRFLATRPHPAGHSRQTVEKYEATPGTIPSGGTTYGISFCGTWPRSSAASWPQPPAATAAPDVAMILKNARRSIPLIPLSVSRFGDETGALGLGSLNLGRKRRAHRPSTLVRSSRGIAQARHALPRRAIQAGRQTERRGSGLAAL